MNSVGQINETGLGNDEVFSVDTVHFYGVFVASRIEFFNILRKNYARFHGVTLSDEQIQKFFDQNPQLYSLAVKSVAETPGEQRDVITSEQPSLPAHEGMDELEKEDENDETPLEHGAHSESAVPQSPLVETTWAKWEPRGFDAKAPKAENDDLLEALSPTSNSFEQYENFDSQDVDISGNNITFHRMTEALNELEEFNHTSPQSPEPIITLPTSPEQQQSSAIRRAVCNPFIEKEKTETLTMTAAAPVAPQSCTPSSFYRRFIVPRTVSPLGSAGTPSSQASPSLPMSAVFQHHSSPLTACTNVATEAREQSSLACGSAKKTFALDEWETDDDSPKKAPSSKPSNTPGLSCSRFSRFTGPSRSPLGPSTEEKSSQQSTMPLKSVLDNPFVLHFSSK